MCYSNTQITTREYCRQSYILNQVNSRNLISLSNVQNTTLINSQFATVSCHLSAHKQRAFNAAWNTAVSTLFTIFTYGLEYINFNTITVKDFNKFIDKYQKHVIM